MGTLALLAIYAAGVRVGRALERSSHPVAWPIMENPTSGAPAPHTRIAWLAERQLTLGECIALARYADTIPDPGQRTVGQMLALLDELRVCTTCGWSEQLHTTRGGSDDIVGLCAHFTRDL